MPLSGLAPSLRTPFAATHEFRRHHYVPGGDPSIWIVHRTVSPPSRLRWPRRWTALCASCATRGRDQERNIERATNDKARLLNRSSRQIGTDVSHPKVPQAATVSVSRRGRFLVARVRIRNAFRSCRSAPDGHQNRLSGARDQSRTLMQIPQNLEHPVANGKQTNDAQ